MSKAELLPRNRLLVGATRAALVLFWVAAFAATHLPVPNLPHTGVSNDKLQHLVAYALLGALLTATLATFRPWSWRLVAFAIAIAATYGVVDELTQAFVGRTPDIKDWVADLIGATMGSISAGVLCTAYALWRNT